MKKYFKKISALLMAAIMVLSMCTSVFAATKNTANISVDNADNATLTYAQVIKADQTTRTGWNFVNDNVAKAYIDAFKVADAQAAIDAVIANADAGKLGLAQANAANHVTFVPMDKPQEVSEAGIYLIKATEAKYTYNIMGAYVGFGPVGTEQSPYDYPSLEDATVTAKKAPITVTKAITAGDDEADNVTKTGDILTYTVKTNVPYIKPTDEDKTFFVYDELTGAEYYNTNTATITLAGTDVTGTYPISWDNVNNKFSVDLRGMIDDANSNAGKAIVITYQVKVTAENDTITNKAKAGHTDGEQYGSAETKTYEGNITLTKTNTDNEVLADAEFEVRKDSKGSAALKFVKLENGDYKYVPNGYEPAADTVTTLVTKSDGTIKVIGLDKGKYYFKETKAPTGYYVNTTDAEAELTLGKDEAGNDITVANGVLTATTNMTDTKLSQLPSTGGMGTYIFTIVGVVLMACAAGAFFMSRRKTEE